MPVSDKVFNIYQRFYAQKGVLAEAPQLTIDPNTTGAGDFPVEQAVAELDKIASYLLGVSDIRRIPFDDRVKSVQNAYKDQPFWRDLLFDYLDMTLDLEDEALADQGDTLMAQAQQALFDIYDKEDQQNALVDRFAEAVSRQGFHVDAKRLIQNYFKMARKDSDKAWDVLIDNPAYFSPIQARDGDQIILSPDQARDENKRLGQFLKGLNA